MGKSFYRVEVKYRPKPHRQCLNEMQQIRLVMRTVDRISADVRVFYGLLKGGLLSERHQTLIDGHAPHPKLHGGIPAVRVQLLKKGNHGLYHVVFRLILLWKVPLTQPQHKGR
jgi:hypothetical protein